MGPYFEDPRGCSGDRVSGAGYGFRVPGIGWRAVFRGPESRDPRPEGLFGSSGFGCRVSGVGPYFEDPKPETRDPRGVREIGFWVSGRTSKTRNPRPETLGGDRVSGAGY